MSRRFLLILFLILAGLLVSSAAQTADIKKGIDTSEKAYVGIVIDCSGSQRLSMDRVIGAVKQFTEGMNDSDEAFVLRFVDAAKISVVQELTSSHTDIQDAVEGLYVEGGLTAVIDGVDAAGRYLSRNLPEGSGKGVLVLISDGEDRGSGRKPDDVIAAMKEKNIRIFSIGISDLKVSTKLLERLARETGGKSYGPRNAGEISTAVIDIIKSIHGGSVSK